MKRLLHTLVLLCGLLNLQAQTLRTSSPMLDSAFSLAVRTIDHNTHDGILHAGAGYGGEWTRDASINSWFAASLLRPQVAEKSLWSVTEDSVRIGHQYWDKMLWAVAAMHHFRVTGDTVFLRKAYDCAKLTMAELEAACFDTAYGLFMGPAVFQDGIEAYPEPVYDPQKWDDSYVLHHPHSDSIRCLSTNVMYAQAYHTLFLMALTFGEREEYLRYSDKRAQLSQNIHTHLFDEKKCRFYYLIDHQGTRHPYQEGLGVSLALLSVNGTGIGDPAKIIRRLHKTPYGPPSVYPSFPRNSRQKPGRHNMMIWPHINAFYALACARWGHYEEFYRELENMARLAIVKGHGNFYEIYTVRGEPSGGWQCGSLWDKKEHQTWCAAGYLSLWLKEVFGISPHADHLTLSPIGMADGSECTLSGLRWRGSDITVTVRGRQGRNTRLETTLNGKPTTTMPTILPNQGPLHFDITIKPKTQKEIKPHIQ